jgi:hypothetical protein
MANGVELSFILHMAECLFHLMNDFHPGACTASRYVAYHRARWQHCFVTCNHSQFGPNVWASEWKQAVHSAASGYHDGQTKPTDAAPEATHQIGSSIWPSLARGGNAFTNRKVR